MPTIIALDISVSMQKNIPGRNDTYLQLAAKGISNLLDYLAHIKLEHVALITYSSAVEIKVDFTRDYDLVRQAVKKLETVDKLNPLLMLKTASNIMSCNWGAQGNCQIVAFTDCGIGVGATSIRTFLNAYNGKEDDPEYGWIEPLRAVKLHFICMGLQSDYYFTKAVQQYQQLMDKTKLNGHLFTTKSVAESSVDVAEADDSTKEPGSSSKPSTSAASSHSSHKSELGRTAMLEMIDRLIEVSFKVHEASLKCGSYFRLECPIIIWPTPKPYKSSSNASEERKITQQLEICGYVSLSDIGSPSSWSRHLIIPKGDRDKSTRRSSFSNLSKYGLLGSSVKLEASLQNTELEKLELDIRDFYKDGNNTDDSGDDTTEATASKSSSNSMSGLSDGQKESMCVLLHGALKVENMAALVLLGENWYGFIYPYADSKKKSNLMLNILPPGNNVIPWLGDMQMLGLAEDLMAGETSSGFPVKAEKRSYSQSCVVWIHHVSLQADIQKVLRHAKKMPEKTQHFYKELNRIRRAALSIGFVELLEAMASLFEKESAQLAMNVNPECSVQLKHAAIELRKPSNRDLKVTIVPVAKFANVEGSSAAAGGVGVGAGGFGY